MCPFSLITPPLARHTAGLKEAWGQLDEGKGGRWRVHSETGRPSEFQFEYKETKRMRRSQGLP